MVKYLFLHEAAEGGGGAMTSGKARVLPSQPVGLGRVFVEQQVAFRRAQALGHAL